MEKNLFNELGNEVFNLVEEDFISCTLNIEAYEGSVKYQGYYLDKNNTKHGLDVGDIDNDFTMKLIDWYKISNQSKNYKWNRAVFTLNNKNQANLDYIWDQELADELDSY